MISFRLFYYYLYTFQNACKTPQVSRTTCLLTSLINTNVKCSTFFIWSCQDFSVFHLLPHSYHDRIQSIILLRQDQLFLQIQWLHYIQCFEYYLNDLLKMIHRKPFYWVKLCVNMWAYKKNTAAFSLFKHHLYHKFIIFMILLCYYTLKNESYTYTKKHSIYNNILNIPFW